MEFTVIVIKDESNLHLYNALFAEAYQLLEKDGKVREDCVHEDKAFQTLEEYFAHIGDLSEYGAKFLMLPLDENPFTINANNRTISPQKITILQNDHMAEMVMFTVDRYVDFKDLNEAHIYVQWTNKNGDMRADLVVMKDITTIPGKIRFGWPLTQEVTAVPGVVNYSIRFWNKITDEEATDGAESVSYSLNTLTSSLTITQSLQPVINDLGQVTDPTNYFKRAVKNSQYTDGSIALPMTPAFDELGVNLEKTLNLNENNVANMEAEATVYDSGALQYYWYFSPAKDMELSNGEQLEAGKTYKVEKDSARAEALGVTVGDKFEEVDEETYQLTVLPGAIKYYSFDGKNYIAYAKTTPPVRVEGDTTTYLYRRRASYSINDSETGVVGVYSVRATNTLGKNTSIEGPSGACEILGPSPIEFTTNLENYIFLTAQEGEEIPSVELAIATKEDSRGEANMTSQWYNKAMDAAEWSEIEGASADSITVTTPGYYQANVISTLNRDSIEANSNKCIVTFEPKVPIVTLMDGMIDSDEVEDGMQVYCPLNTSMQIGVVANVDIDSAYAGYDKELFSEELIYVWYMQLPNKPREEIKSNNKIVESGLGTGVLTIKPTAANVYSFTCEVSNKIDTLVSDPGSASIIVRAV